MPGHYLLRTRAGEPYSASSYSANRQRLTARVTRPGKNGAPPILANRFTFCAVRAKSSSDSVTVREAQERLGHTSEATTRRVYMRAPLRVKPLR